MGGQFSQEKPKSNVKHFVSNGVFYRIPSCPCATGKTHKHMDSRQNTCRKDRYTMNIIDIRKNDSIIEKLDSAFMTLSKLTRELGEFDGKRQHATYQAIAKEKQEAMSAVADILMGETFAHWDTINDAFADGTVPMPIATYSKKESMAKTSTEERVFDLVKYLTAKGWDADQLASLKSLFADALMGVSAYAYNSVYNNGEDSDAVMDAWNAMFGAPHSDMIANWGRNPSLKTLDAITEAIGVNLHFKPVHLREMITFGNVITITKTSNTVRICTVDEFITLFTRELVHIVSGRDFNIVK